MGDHTSCADWEYGTHPQRSDVTTRCNRLVEWLKEWPRRFLRYGLDTRAGHKLIFSGMAPATCACLVGDYRGTASCNALSRYNVQVASDPRVGVPFWMVAPELAKLEARCEQLFAALERWRDSGHPKATEAVIFTRFVSVVATLLQEFLAIHPYANGNGHMGRLLVWVLMMRFGYIPTNWPLDKSPAYANALSEHRSGRPRDLEAFLIRSIVGQPQANPVGH